MRILLPAWVALAILAHGPAAAGGDPWQLEVGPVAGATALDPQLADYRWDTAPRFESGLGAMVGRDGWGLGLRLRRTDTTQGLALTTDLADPTVRLTSAELLGRLRLARPLGVEVWAGGQAGWLHMGYTPDALTFTTGSTGVPVTVDFAPVDEPVFGGGLTLRRPLGAAWAAALGAEASTFALDTSHRQGQRIVHERERFWNWSLRLAVTWRTELGS